MEHSLCENKICFNDKYRRAEYFNMTKIREIIYTLFSWNTFTSSIIYY